MTMDELKAAYTVAYGYCHCGCGQQTQMAKQTEKRAGWIKGQPVRYVVGHSGGPKSRPTEVRFWECVAPGPEEECWPWQGYRNKRGYGCLTIGGRNGRAVHTHRLAWELNFGSIPDGLCVLHKCDNPPCCNPNHLFLGTDADNVADKVKKGRQARGEHHGQSTLTTELVLQIRKLHADGGKTSVIARLLKMPYSTVRNIINRTRWGHIP